jgi:hypothetical protein
LIIHRFELLQAGSSGQPEESLDELVQLASGAGDPALYALAFAICGKWSSEAVPVDACQRITVSEWTRLDPDNAMPWLLIAQAARNKSDTQAEALAFAKAATAHKIDDYSSAVFAFGLTELPQGIVPVEKMALAIELMGIEAALPSPALSETSRYCSDAALQRDEIHAECNSIAELLVTRGNNLLTLGIGARLGGRVGWPAERVERLSQERDDLMGLAAGPLPDSCDTVTRMDAFLDRRAQLGELGSLRELHDRPELQIYQ